uniref:Uncharacterized protein n=1 Tax=Phyllymenia taiwanensis TaxID=1260292 RepID=R9XYN9_9FLOR|nr:hypothetical protein [Grateloupia taiwanensis]AGO19786.1 hypothetical protein [Grateloupia taiwanensis]
MLKKKVFTNLLVTPFHISYFLVDLDSSLYIVYHELESYSY